MVQDSFYDIRNVPFTSRESFNNTILLLTLVKSDYYYITGFDRLKNIIEIAFDFESELHSKITESVTINFDFSPEAVLFTCELKNAFADKQSALLLKKQKKEEWSMKKGKLVYELKIQKDSIFPLGVKDMNEIILGIRKDIYNFLENYYLFILSKKKEKKNEDT